MSDEPLLERMGPYPDVGVAGGRPAPPGAFAARLRREAAAGPIRIAPKEADALADALETMASWVDYPQLPSSCETEMRDALDALDRLAEKGQP